MENLLKKMISVRALTKDYGQGRGIFDVTFDIAAGECFGFLGPNGAGKSTTVRHLLGFTKPDSGEALIKGLSAFKDHSEVMADIGYLPGEIALPAFLTGREVIREQLSLKHVKDESFAISLIDYFQLDVSLLCKQMSLGQKRRLAVVCAFCSDPSVLILDEPTSGLDPLMQERFIELINREKKRGRTMLFCSHIFSEVEKVCDRIAVIKDGRIVSIFNASDLKHATDKTFRVTFASEEELTGFLNESKACPWGIKSSDRSLYSVVLRSNDKDVNILLSILRKYHLKDLSIERTTLEERFMGFYREEKSFGGV